MKEFEPRGKGFASIGNYQKIKQRMQIEHDVYEGETVILRRMVMDMITGKYHEKDLRVKVESVDKWHITIRHKAGFCESLSWKQFDEERVPDLHRR